ncbi:MAG: nicotinate-nucleotide adenylyltransferase [Bacteroidales bacterium]|nr:nicotinate-nucleotide adenylyltransferase [Candidatus Colicola coprequi]
MARIGIYGGSFNPIHFGHIGLVRWITEHTDLDEVWMMVSPNNPLKDSSVLVDEQVRLEEVKRVVQDIPHVKVSDFEFALPRPSYTANTLRELQRAYPTDEFTLIIGEDNWTIFNRWREWEYILENFRIMVYPRHGETEGNSIRYEGQGDTRVLFLSQAPYYDISSTQLRAQMPTKTQNANK